MKVFPQRELGVILVEDEVATRQSLCDLIRRDPRLFLVAEADSVATGLAALEQEYDVVVVDLGLPDGNGIDVVSRSAQDGNGHRLVLTIFGDEKSVISALEAGADGYVLKDDKGIADAIVAVADGHVPLTPSVAVHLTRRLIHEKSGKSDLLTPREVEILTCLARGFSYKETAGRLSISYHTVTDHIKAIYKKLHVNSRSSAVYQGLRSGLISLRADG